MNFQRLQTRNRKSSSKKRNFKFLFVAVSFWYQSGFRNLGRFFIQHFWITVFDETFAWVLSRLLFHLRSEIGSYRILRDYSVFSICSQMASTISYLTWWIYYANISLQLFFWDRYSRKCVLMQFCGRGMVMLYFQAEFLSLFCPLLTSISSL